MGCSWLKEKKNTLVLVSVQSFVINKSSHRDLSELEPSYVIEVITSRFSSSGSGGWGGLDVVVWWVGGVGGMSHQNKNISVGKFNPDL